MDCLVANGSQRTKSGGKRYSVKPALAEDMDLDGRMQSKNIPQRNIVRLSASSIFPPVSLFLSTSFHKVLKKKKLTYFHLTQVFLYFTGKEHKLSLQHKPVTKHWCTFCIERITYSFITATFGIEVRMHKSIFHIPLDQHSL